MSKEICQRCGESDYDRRTLLMSCLYEMNELELPFYDVNFKDGDNKKHFYALRVCKDCRADWLLSIKNWFNEKPIREGG